MTVQRVRAGLYAIHVDDVPVAVVVRRWAHGWELVQDGRHSTHRTLSDAAAEVEQAAR